MAERVAVRDITNEEGRKLLSIVRRGSGSVVRWRRAQIVLWSAQRMDVPAIAKIAFTSEDRVREVIHNFNADGFDSLAAKYAGGRPPKFTLPERREIKKIVLSRPVDHNLPFSTWLSKLAEYLVAEGVVDDISHGGLRVLLREEGVSFQVIKTYKQSNDPDFEAEKNRVCSSSMRLPMAWQNRRGAIPASSSAWTSSARSTSCPDPASSGHWGSSRETDPAQSPGAGDAEPPTPAPRECVTSWPPRANACPNHAALVGPAVARSSVGGRDPTTLPAAD
jgi:transposase